MFLTKYKQAIAVILTVFLTINLNAEFEVFDNEYIITEKKAVVSGFNSSSDYNHRLRSLGNTTVKQISNNRRIVGRETFYQRSRLSSAKEIKPYDPNDTFCEEVVAAGLAENCTPNFVVKLHATTNDTDKNKLWGLTPATGINAEQAWDVTKGSNDVVVAVIDTGIDYNHPDLKANIWVNPGEIPGNGIDDDNNGYIDDVHGVSTIDQSGNPLDIDGHGTHVAGTIGAVGNNGRGVVGVNQKVKLMAVKFIDGNNGGSLANAIEAIEYVTMMKQRGVNIVASNNSWGGISFVQVLKDVIRDSIDAGSIFVAAAGNSNRDIDEKPTYPASFELDGLVSVAAIDEDQNKSSFSNYGAASVDIAAPGTAIYSTWPGNGYLSLSGTSMATPHVAGAIALYRSLNSTDSNIQLIQKLYASAKPLPTLTGLVWSGRTLNVNNLVRGIFTDVTPPTTGECNYEMKKIAYLKDTAADNGEILVQSDEFNFAELNLPFSFPFFDKEYSKLTLSPNGVIYLDNVPVTNDHINDASAPVTSIAALHTDLTAEVDPYGIRARIESDKAVIYWQVKHYKDRLGAGYEVRTVIHESGKITTSLKAGDYTSLDLARTATIGIKGDNSLETATYAASSDSLENYTTVSFEPKCSITKAPKDKNDPSIVTKLNAYSVSRNGKIKTKVLPGRDLFIQVNGLGTGTYDLTLGLNNQTCKGSVSVPLINGVGQVTTRTKRFLKKYKKLNLEIDTLKKKIRIKRNRNKIAQLKAMSRSQQKSLAKRDCQRLMSKNL